MENILVKPGNDDTIDSVVIKEGAQSGESPDKEGEGMDNVTQMGVEAAIAKSEVAHLNAKRIQDEIEDLKGDGRMGYGYGYGGCGEGLLLGLIAAGGYGWGHRGHDGCGHHGHDCHDTIEILRDNHEGVLSVKDDVNRNALREADIRHEDAMRFQKGLDKNELKTVEVGCKLEKDMYSGFKDISDKLCAMEKENLKRELAECERKLAKAELQETELREIIRDNTQTQTLLDAIAAINTAAAGA